MKITRRGQTERQKASALIVTLGVLTVLALLAFTFSGISRGERNISRVYVDQVRARLLAMSGVEKARSMALGGLSSTTNPVYYSISEGSLPGTAYGADAPPPAGTQIYSYPDVPVEYAAFPSARVNVPLQPGQPPPPYTVAPGQPTGWISIPELDNENDIRDPPLTSGKQHLFGASGLLPSSYPRGYDYYAIRLMDGNGRVYVNGEDAVDYGGVPTPLKQNHLRLLNNLGARLAALGKIDNSNAMLGTIVQNARKPVGQGGLGTNIKMLGQLRDYLNNGTTSEKDADLQVLSCVLTTYAWVDRTTLDSSKISHPRINDPNIQYNYNGVIAYGPSDPSLGESALASAPSGLHGLDLLGGLASMGRSNEAGPAVRTGSRSLYSCGTDRLVSDDTGSQWWPHWQRNSSNENSSTPSATSIGPITQPRAPVNMNSASVDVLAAVFTGLTARYLVRRQDTYPSFMGEGYTSSQEVTISATDADKIARQIVTWRRILSRAPGSAMPTGLPATVFASGPDLPVGRNYGFATWSDFNTFVDVELAPDLCGCTTAQARQLYTSATAPTYAPKLALINLVKAAANPNSHLNKFNPDRNFGNIFADVDKGDITAWTTELGFNSGGFYEIESVGRVIGPSDWQGGQNFGGGVMGECKISVAIQLFDTLRLTTQDDFMSPPPPKVICTNVRSYPENLSDLGVAGAARYDGYLMMDTTDQGGIGGSGTSFFAHYTGQTNGGADGDFGQNAAGFATSGRSVIMGTGPSGGSLTPGAQSDLFVDGVFAHETRRYPAYTTDRKYGAPGLFPNQDKYLRNGVAGSKINLQNGTLEMWVKPAFTGNDFNTTVSTTENNPSVESSRVFFSTGEGKLGTDYAAGASGDQSVSDNRVVVFASRLAQNKYSGAQATVPYICAFMSTRLNQEYSNWLSPDFAVNASSPQHVDYWGQYGSHWVNGVKMVKDMNFLSVNPKNWQYPGLWHHICFRWNGSQTTTNSNLVVDGQAEDASTPGWSARINNTSPSRKQLPSMFQNSWSLFIGHSRFNHTGDTSSWTNGFPCNGDSTIDSVKIYGSDTGLVGPPHRYRQQGSYVGVMGPLATAGGIPKNCTLLNISWTAHYPEFNTMTSTLNFKLSGTGTTGNWTWQQTPPPLQTVPNPPLGTGATEPPENSITGRGIRLPDYSVNAGSELRLQVDFTQSGSWVAGSVILDDVTVTTVPDGGGGKYLYYTIN